VISFDLETREGVVRDRNLRRAASRLCALSRRSPSCVDPQVTVVSDAELLRRLRAGDAAAFDAAYDRYAPRLYRFLLRLCKNRESAEDVLQEAWLKLATRAHELAVDTDLVAWLFTVARNAWVSRARHEGRLVEFADADERSARDPSPEASSVLSSSVRALERALAALGEGDREILLLVGVEELSHSAAAAVLGVGDVAFRQRLHRARSRLAAELDRAPRRASSDWTEE
jgi:RNA polymerase sigma-70 factor (ECF subfamily)